jgi:hypothetical protein
MCYSNYEVYSPRGMLVLRKEVMRLNSPVREDRARALVKQFTR